MCKKLLALLLLLLCSSCVGAVSEQEHQLELNPPAQSQQPRSLPSLAIVQQGDTVEIQNDWNGYSDITPILRHYKLRRQQQQLVGNAHIAIGGYGAAGIRQQATTKTTIPAPVTVNFLATLAKTPIKLGVYKPRRDRSDDYPRIKITVRSKQQQTIFSSESQGGGAVPWRVTVGGGKNAMVYISNSDTPDRALKLLNPYLSNPPGIEAIIQRRRKGK
jgi:hypothetical protein